MSKVLVLYYSAYGHIEAMANAVAEGAREAGATVDIKRVPELVPAEVAKASHYKLDQAAPVAAIADLADYDAIIVGTGTRFGRVSSQMANFLDQAGGLWARGALHGKVGGAFKERIDEEEAMNMSRRHVLAAGGKAAMIAMAGAPHASRAQSPSAQTSPDLIVHNAKVTTLQRDGHEAQAFAARGEKNVAVGGAGDIMGVRRDK